MPSFLEITSMSSFSDAHECTEIPVIAANLHRAVLPRQSQIWAVLHPEQTLQRVHYQMASTFLGRCCLSGGVDQLSGGAVGGGGAGYCALPSGCAGH